MEEEYICKVSKDAITTAWVSWTEWSYLVSKYDVIWAKRIAIKLTDLNRIIYRWVTPEEVDRILSNND